MLPYKIPQDKILTVIHLDKRRVASLRQKKLDAITLNTFLAWSRSQVRRFPLNNTTHSRRDGSEQKVLAGS